MSNTNPNPNHVRAEAEKQLREELFEEAVEAMKIKIRNSRKSWFPWRLLLINVNEEK